MKKALLALLSVIAVGLFALVGHAAGTPRDVNVYLFDDYPDCVFFVIWENTDQSATVQIKDPEGAVTFADAKNTVFGSGRATVSLGSVKSGFWIVTVTGEDLGAIGVSGGDKSGVASQYNAIQSFSADVADGSIHFKWDVTADADQINVSISATQGGVSGSRSLWSDYAADKNGTIDVFVDELKTGLYSFGIQAFDGSNQYTQTTEGPLYIQQSDAPEKLEGVKVGSIDGQMYAAWDMRLNSRYLVTLYDYDTLSVIKSEWTSGVFYPFTLPDGITKAKFSVCAVESSAYGAFDVYEIIRAAPGGEITFPNVSATRESAVRINISCADDTTAGLYLDGTLLLENAASGDYDLTLSEGVHEVVAYIKDGDGNMKTFTKEIAVDKTPPVINLNAADTVKTVSDSFVLEGSTEPNAVVSVNGVEQELGAGGFIAKLALRYGVNPITVAAYDAAGNKGRKTISAERTGALAGDWTLYVLPCAVFVLLTVWYVRLNKKTKGARADEEVD
ncbi:MAG: hypothetical protein LBU58_03830 [Clostridiales bacterium]|jgi:hypothetical protein|nr:hypothetical protein [Clostridiales bacterium]